MTSEPRIRSKGTEVRKRRLQLFLTPAELATKADISVTTLKTIERKQGQEFLRLSTVRKLAAALGCEPQDISEVTTGEEVAS